LMRAISNTLALHGGTVAGGTMRLRDRDLATLGPAAIVRAGVVQVPEGRRIFGDLTVEENLRAGTFGRTGRQGVAAAHQRVLDLFPRLAERRDQHASLLSGGERPGADERPEAAAARRALAGPRPAARRQDRRDRPADQRAGDVGRAGRAE